MEIWFRHYCDKTKLALTEIRCTERFSAPLDSSLPFLLPQALLKLFLPSSVAASALANFFFAPQAWFDSPSLPPLPHTDISPTSPHPLPHKRCSTRLSSSSLSHGHCGTALLASRARTHAA